MDDAADKGRP